MVSDLSVQKIYQFIVNDFEGAWNSLADKLDTPGEEIGRGNFMFAAQAMILLEFASRLCKGKPKMLDDFSRELDKIDPKYFKLLPSRCVPDSDQFNLPYMGDKDGRDLLWALFDLIRNGLAHQYQQIIVKLKDKKLFYVSIAWGADHSRRLNGSRPPDHLDCKLDESGDLVLKVYPDILFLDFKKAIINSNLLNRNPSFDRLYRPRNKDRYDFDSISLIKSLNCDSSPKAGD